MPELPEVETMRRGIAGIAGCTIAAGVRLPCRRRPILIRPRPAALSRRLAGQRIEEVGRLGKRVVLRLASGDRLIFEPRMTGLVLVADPPSAEHLRFRLDLADGPVPHVWYWDRRGLGSIRLVSERQLAEHLGSGRLGPDALVLTPDELQSRLGTSRRAIKVALLDQRAVAGIGNLYASEILHLAEVHPGKRCDLLRPAQWQAIHARMLEVLQAAILHEGSTLSDGTYRNALNQAGGYQNQHRVYDRADQPCRQCDKGRIVRIVQAQRATFFCPLCQRKTDRRSGVIGVQRKGAKAQRRREKGLC
jgi:formamidopyrimidine-DNA glycosylase